MATALIQPLAWKPPYAAGVALEIAKKTKKKKRKRKEIKALAETNGSCVAGMLNRNFRAEGDPEPGILTWVHGLARDVEITCKMVYKCNFLGGECPGFSSDSQRGLLTTLKC